VELQELWKLPQESYVHDGRILGQYRLAALCDFEMTALRVLD
jgi:hypothetical protein